MIWSNLNKWRRDVRKAGAVHFEFYWDSDASMRRRDQSKVHVLAYGPKREEIGIWVHGKGDLLLDIVDPAKSPKFARRKGFSDFVEVNPVVSTMGININDKCQDFTGQILRGEKTIETRTKRTLDSYIGKRVGLIRTGIGKATLVGYATVGEPITYTSMEMFRRDYNNHRISPGSAYDFKGDVRYGYPLTQVQPVEHRMIESRGIVSRKLNPTARGVRSVLSRIIEPNDRVLCYDRAKGEDFYRLWDLIHTDQSLNKESLREIEGMLDDDGVLVIESGEEPPGLRDHFRRAFHYQGLLLVQGPLNSEEARINTEQERREA